MSAFQTWDLSTWEWRGGSRHGPLPGAGLSESPGSLKHQPCVKYFTCLISLNLHKYSMKWVILHKGKLRLSGIKCIPLGDLALGAGARTELRAVRKASSGTSYPQGTASLSVFSYLRFPFFVPTTQTIMYYLKN